MRLSLRLAAAFLAGAICATAAIALASDETAVVSTNHGVKVVSIHPTGVGLPLIGAHGTLGAGDLAGSLRAYHDSGAYESDLTAVDSRAHNFLARRIKTMRKRAKPALVLDIDETSLSNYSYLAQANFTGAEAALVAAVVASNDPPIAPTLKLFRYARGHGVAVFFITGRPGNIPFVRQQTVKNLTSAGYARWTGLDLNPGGLGTVAYKSQARKRIEKRGYTIVANVGDQLSDLQGGFAERAFKLPNPFYFIGP